MERKPISPEITAIPETFRWILTGAQVFDSSCSPEAQVLYVDRDDGYYLKSAPAGSLKSEADLTQYFHSKGVAAEVLAYETGAADWMLTRRVPGEDSGCSSRPFQRQTISGRFRRRRFRGHGADRVYST